MWLWLVSAAFADTLVLDNGSEVRGALVSWKEDGGCVLRVDEGALEGVIVQIPCERILAFARDEVASQARSPVASAPVAAAPIAAAPAAAVPVTAVPVAASAGAADQPASPPEKTRNRWLTTLQEEWSAVKEDLKPSDRGE